MNRRELLKLTGAAVAASTAASFQSSEPSHRLPRDDVCFFDVTEFGATGGGTVNDRIAIQAAIKKASECEFGGVVYFPAGTYLIEGGSLTLPPMPPDIDSTDKDPGRQFHFSPRVIVLRGDAWRVSAIVNGNPDDEDNPVPLIVPEKLEGGTGVRGYVVEDLELGRGGHYQEVFHWSPEVNDPDAPTYRIEIFFHRVMFTSEKNLIGPDRHLVRLVGASRTRFLHCIFTGLGHDVGGRESLVSKNWTGGAAVKLEHSGGVTMTDCRTVEAGAMIDAFWSGEIVMSHCRSEGAKGRPAWKFKQCHNVTLINPANEGDAGNPSLFEFDDCNDIVVINPQFALPITPISGVGMVVSKEDLPADPPPWYKQLKEGEDAYFVIPEGQFPHTVLVNNCRNVHIIGGHVGRPGSGDAISDYGNGKARLIRITSSHNVTAENIPTRADITIGNPELAAAEFEISRDSTFCRIEASTLPVRVQDPPTKVVVTERSLELSFKAQ